MTAKVVHLVLDTNVFMHFAWADVDWCGLAGADEVVLVVPAVVIGELDRHRKEHRSSAMRDRTRAVISRLRTLRTSTGPAMIRDHVELRPWLDSPRCWGNHDALDRSIADDHVLATALDIRGAGSDVALVSDDTIPAMKASTLRLRVVEPPDQHRLPPAADQAEQELRKAKAELAAMKSARPRVVCSLDGGAREVEIYANELAEASADVGEMVRSEARRVPERVYQAPPEPPPLPTTGTPGELAAARAARSIAEILRATEPRPADVARFNQDRRRYLEDYVEHIRALAEWASVAGQFHAVRIVLTNEGQVAADDVDVFLTTRGCAFREPSELPERPEPPTPPDRWAEPVSVAFTEYVPDHSLRQSAPVPTSSVREDGTWHGHIPRLKQGLTHEFYVVVERPTPEWVTPVEIGMNIVVGNGVGDSRGKLLVRFLRGQPASGET